MKAEKVIFPGQGRAQQAKAELQRLGIWEILPDIKVPFLGICLGMQLLFSRSEEDDTQCLNIITGEVKRFNEDSGIKVPQMGWNSIIFTQKDPLLSEVKSGSYFYLANSYYVQTEPKYIFGLGRYDQEFAAIIKKDNFYGVQFHPEKSGETGMQLLKNFCESPSKLIATSTSTEIIPAIDLIDGKCVRLNQGDYDQRTEYDSNPIQMAQEFEAQGASVIHVIDLDGAKEGRLCNEETVLKIAQSVQIPVQTGGGIRSYDDAQMLLQNGVKRIILSTSALKNPELIEKLVENFGADRIIISVDAKNGMVATDGWREVSTTPVDNFLEELKSLGITTIIFTDIEQDGMLSGPNFNSISKVQKSGLKVIVAGGVSSQEDVEKLKKMNVNGVIIGKAIYEGHINLSDVTNNNFNILPQNGLTKRIVACMDIDKGRVVKGTNYQELKDAGDPVELAKMYSQMGIDELVFLDITATIEKRKTLIELVQRISQNITIPFTVGGGIKSIEDIRAMLAHGADKVAIESAAVINPEFIKEAAQTFGSQCIVISISPKKLGDTWQIYIKGGRENTGIDAIAFCKKMEKLGAGELLVNSLDRDGTKKGYDLELLNTISKSVNIPIIASSGAGTKEHFLEAFTEGKCDAVLAAGIFHSQEIHIPELKEYLFSHNISLRS